MNFKFTSIIFTIVILIASCNKKETKEPIKTETTTTSNTLDYSGEYASSTYFEKDNDKDWIAVLITNVNDSSLLVSIRSRVDIKRPTCTNDFTAVKLKDNVFKHNVENGAVVLTFSDKKVTISSEGSDEFILNRACSGGGTYAGEFIKSDAPIDREKLDPTKFTKAINWVNGISCFVNSSLKNNIETLNVSMVDKTGKVIETSQEIKGTILNAEADDMDGDGYPEILVYAKSAEKSDETVVFGFSPNNGKSISPIYFPSKADTKGYEGFIKNNSFALVETQLIERFPLFEKKGADFVATGKTQSLQYKLVNGEASKQFKLYKTIAF
jgi:hypothetical protein